jgi:hypothetical protein
VAKVVYSILYPLFASSGIIYLYSTKENWNILYNIADAQRAFYMCRLEKAIAGGSSMTVSLQQAQPNFCLHMLKPKTINLREFK